MNRSKRTTWKRLAAGMLLASGLTAVGAEYVYRTMREAHAQGRVDAGKLETGRQLLLQSRTALDAGDLVRAKDLATQAKSLGLPPTFGGADTPDRLIDEVVRKLGTRPANAPVQANSEDPKALVKKGRTALETGRLDLALDLARQAEANARAVSWGLFEDNPVSLLKDVQKAKAKRDQLDGQAKLAMARNLLGQQATSPAERAANLDRARNLVLEADKVAAGNGVWDYGERPQALLAEIETARAQVKVPPTPIRPQTPKPAPVVTKPVDTRPTMTVQTIEPPRTNVAPAPIVQVQAVQESPIMPPAPAPVVASGRMVMPFPRPTGIEKMKDLPWPDLYTPYEVAAASTMTAVLQVPPRLVEGPSTYTSPGVTVVAAVEPKPVEVVKTPEPVKPIVKEPQEQPRPVVVVERPKVETPIDPDPMAFLTQTNQIGKAAEPLPPKVEPIKPVATKPNPSPYNPTGLAMDLGLPVAQPESIGLIGMNPVRTAPSISLPVMPPIPEKPPVVETVKTAEPAKAPETPKALVSGLPIAGMPTEPVKPTEPAVVIAPLPAKVEEKPVVIAPLLPPKVEETPVVIAPLPAKVEEKPVVIAPLPAKVEEKVVVAAPKVEETPGVAVVEPPLTLETPAEADRVGDAKAKSDRLMKEAKARELAGKYVEAKALLTLAQKQGLVYSADEETPEARLMTLQANALQQMNKLCSSAHEKMMKKDAASVAEAEQMLGQAELIGVGMNFDLWALTQHKDTLRVVKAAAGMPSPEPKTEVAMAPRVVPAGVAEQPAVDLGEEMLKVARLELQRGDTENARRIVTRVINGPYAAKEQAQALLHSIDGEETVQKQRAAVRSYEHGLTAYQNRNFEQALAIFKQIDPALLPATKKNSMSELMMSANKGLKQKQGGDVVAAAGTEETGKVVPAVEPRNGADSLLKQQEAMQEVLFQKLRSEGLDVESKATARFGKGETQAAIQDMEAFIAKAKNANLDSAKIVLLTRPVESRLENLKLLEHRQSTIMKESKSLRDFRSTMSQEALHRAHQKDEVNKLVREAQRLMDEHKYKEANTRLVMARELDPEDPSLTMMLQMSKTQNRRENWKEAMDEKERLVYEGIHDTFKQGPATTITDPLKIDAKAYKASQARPDLSNGISEMKSRSDRERQIEAKLESLSVNIDFKNTPLDEVVRYLQTYTGVNMQLDVRALQAEGGTADSKMPISSTLNDIKFKSALGVIADQAGLKYVIENDVVKLTTAKGARGKMIRKTYPVADLIVPVQNAQPKGVSSMEQQLERVSGGNRLNSRGGPFQPTRGLNNSTVETMGTSSNGNKLVNDQGNGWDVQKSNANGTIEESLIRLITRSVKADSWQTLGGHGTIEYYPLGMALVINQSADVLDEVGVLLRSLRDLQDLEVAIEVRMITLAETFYERIGLDFSLNIKTNTNKAEPSLTLGAFQAAPFVNDNRLKGTVLGLQAPGVPTSDLDIPIRATSFAQAIPPFGGYQNAIGSNGGIALGLAFLNDIQVQMFLEAAQGDRRTNVMQAPKLTMFNGQSAQISINDQQFFLTDIEIQSVNGQLVYIPNNQPFPLGVSMNMQPVVSGDRRFVRLNIQQQMTNLASATVPLFPITTFVTPVLEGGFVGQPIPFTQYVQQPTFSSINVQTTVVVPDGGTVLLGGLKTLSEGRNEFGPPVLSKIPYVNRLFKNVGYGRESQSLMMMVTPRIIINREEEIRQTGEPDQP